MAVETIKKFQPHRTIQLRGFEGHGAAAAPHGGSNSGFTITGDFCVLMLWTGTTSSSTTTSTTPGHQFHQTPAHRRPAL